MCELILKNFNLGHNFLTRRDTQTKNIVEEIVLKIVLKSRDLHTIFQYFFVCKWA